MVLLTRDDYTVGWLCALPLSELVAAKKMLDGEHDPLQLPFEDENTYAYGSINNHNVVIACMPPGLPGKVSAAKLVQPLGQSFPKMRIHLFVGVGGGVPQFSPDQNPEKDIHLGDVVVGWPDVTGAPAVVQFDLIERQGEQVDKQRLLSTLDKPDRRLLTALGHLVANHTGRWRHFSKHLQKLSDLEDFANPGCEKDNLYRSNYGHAGGDTCENCDPEQVIHRGSRKKPAQPNFHQGTILSGDSVLKDAQKRDELSQKYFNAICFEMEAAGVVDQKHCLVIRGISDYSDGHKNGSWQPYAAATAAAFAREFLYTIQPNTAKELPHVTETALIGASRS
jgi:nucleoside phosphorylase